MTIITFVAILAALLVVTSTSTVYSVLWLVGTFMIISVLLGFLNLGFPALLYVIVYVGAIAILFLFVIQLLDLGLEQSSSVHDKVFVKKVISQTSGIPLIIIVSFALSTIFALAANVNNVFNSLDNIIYSFHNDLSVITFIESSTQVISSSISGGSPQVLSIAEWFYGVGLLPLIIISIILLVAMIAPISLCKEEQN